MEKYKACKIIGAIRVGSIITQWLGDKRIDTARIDIKNHGERENNVHISIDNDAECQLDAPSWFSRGGRGYVLNSSSRHLALNLTCVKNGVLSICLRGLNQGKPAHRIPVYIDYSRLVVNGDDVFNKAKSLWHDNSYTFEKNVKDGDVVKAEIYWEPHEYTEDELSRFVNLEFMEMLIPAAKSVRSSVDFRSCIDSFENGENNIYILDDNEQYSWWSINENSFNLTFNSEGNMQFALNRTAPVVMHAPADIGSDDAYRSCKEGFAQNPDAKELPVISKDGHLIGKVRRDVPKVETTALDWKSLADMNPDWPKCKIYVSSNKGLQMHGIMDALQNSADVEILSLKNIKTILKENQGILIYGKDLYPDISKMSAENFYRKMKMSAMFKKNVNALMTYNGFNGDLKDFEMPMEMLNQSPKSCIDSFLNQVDSDLPVLLEDAYDVEELAWVCDKLRCTKEYGSDNYLYLYYSSRDVFLKSMCTVDWTYVIETGKIVFLFSQEEKNRYYPIAPMHNEPQQLKIEEISEIVSSIPRSASGSDFFNMILDNHPSLLTIGWHGLPNYAVLWKVFCEGKTVREAIEHMKNPQGKNEHDLLKLNLNNALKYNPEKRLIPFFDRLTKYLNADRKYNISDWFKAFYLSINDTVGRKFKQRIAPAVFYDHHGGLGQYAMNEAADVTSSELDDMNKVMLDGFKYKKYIGIVRSPLGRYGSFHNVYCKFKRKGTKKVDPFVATTRYVVGFTYGDYLKKMMQG